MSYATASAGGGKSARPPAPKAPAGGRAYNPFAPTTVAQMMKTAGIYGPILTNKQINRQAGAEAKAQINPVLAALLGDIGKRETNAETNLGGATAAYEKAASAYSPAAAAAYQGAEGSQAATDAALAQSLSGAGTSLASGLAAKLGQAGLPTAPADATAAIGHGAGNAALASGSAEMGRLIGDSAAAQDYGAKLPGIAANTGVSRAAELASHYAGIVSDRTTQVQQQLPSLVSSLVNALTSRNEQRRSAKVSTIEAEKNRALQTAVFDKEYGIKAYQAQTSAANDAARNQNTAAHNAATAATAQQRNAVSSQSAAERTRHDKATETQAQANAVAKKAATHAQVDAEASRSRGILIGKDGKPILRYKVQGGKRVPGTGRTIPYKPKASSTSSAAGPPPGSPKVKGK